MSDEELYKDRVSLLGNKKMLSPTGWLLLEKQKAATGLVRWKAKHGHVRPGRPEID